MRPPWSLHAGLRNGHRLHFTIARGREKMGWYRREVARTLQRIVCTRIPQILFEVERKWLVQLCRRFGIMFGMKAKYSFKVRTYECGPDGMATLPTICNFLQEAASMNAEALGFSKTDFDSAGENISWVLARLVVRMDRYPKWEDEVTVATFPRGGRKIVAWRDFELFDSSGVRIGAASSEWMLIDLSTRRIVAIPQSVFDAADPADAPVLGEMPFTKFRYPAVSDPQHLAFRAQKSHIDLNGHVNNVHYIEWMLEPYADAHPSQMEVVFRSETLAGEEVLVSSAAEPPRTYHRVYSTGGRDHVVAWTSGAGGGC